MEKINFENNVTKANAETFNTLQDNIELAINGIIESGTASGVNYIKYCDGTLIQYFTQSVTVTEPRSAGGLTYYSASTDVTLALPYINSSYVVATNIQQANMNYFAQAYASQNSNSSVRVSFASTGNGENRNVHVICIGKWK